VRRVLVVAVLLALGIAATACGASSAARTRPRVVASFYPIAYLAAQLGGEAISVRDLTPTGAEPHDLELRPSDVAAVRDANLVLYFDRGFQPAVEDAVRPLPRARAVDLLEGLPLKRAAGGEEGLTADPHVWLSPVVYARMADTVASSLERIVPGPAAAVRTRLSTLRNKLEELDRQFALALDRCDRREIFTSHAAFGYLTERYRLRQVGIEGVSPEAEPSSRRLQTIADEARRAHATTIYFETLVSPRVARTIARIVGVRTAVLNPVEGLTAQERKAGADYFSIMRSNLRALTRGLGCRP
jgi:zinc transport system substrate-binding protein